MAKQEDFKTQLVAAYDADAKRRVGNEKARDDWKLAARKEFADLAKAEGKKSVLEIGAGVGIDADYFKAQGFDVLATDLSPKMVEACKERGLKAQVLDIYGLKGLKKRFDAIYSLNVLLHVPKEDLPAVLEGIYNSLTPSGIFFYGVYGGVDKGEVHTDPKKMNLPRFFSFLSDEALLRAAASKFEVVSSKTIDIGYAQKGLHFQSLLLRKQKKG
jgi:cyclopropane fatty-acyl-phospholipid synthase-like methyltransferase